MTFVQIAEYILNNIILKKNYTEKDILDYISQFSIEGKKLTNEQILTILEYVLELIKETRVKDPHIIIKSIETCFNSNQDQEVAQQTISSIIDQL